MEHFAPDKTQNSLSIILVKILQIKIVYKCLLWQNIMKPISYSLFIIERSTL